MNGPRDGLVIGLRLLVLAAAGLAPAAQAAWVPPDGVELSRPRLLLRDADLTATQGRLEREPYRGLLAALHRRVAQAERVALDDDTIAGQRIKARAAKNLAFLYAIDRTLVDGELHSLSELGQRQLIGDRARDLLLHLYPRSRLAVDPPLGGWDRDISTSEELLQYAVAYDTLLGAGYDFGADHATIEARLVELAAEVYENYIRPETAGNWANLHQNNHRSKTGAALVVAGLALAEYDPPPGSDPRDIRSPQSWVDYGLDLVDLVTRWVLVTGDGSYAEGPFYWRFTLENLLPMARAWHHLLGGAEYVTASGLAIRDFWTHPLFAASGRWMLDMTLPDGSLAPIDDGNPGRSFAFGLLPAPAELKPAFAWRWQNAPAPYESEGNIDLAADAIVHFDDAVVAAPPGGSPTAVYVEGGQAVLRSDWGEDAVVVLVQGEHDTASSFGRDRTGLGVGPQSHEHAEPGSFLLHAFGERLVLDPGYLNFGSREAVNRPEHHSMILVDGRGPVDYLNASLRWNRRSGRPQVDGHATLSDVLDSRFADAVRVTTRYGQPAARIQRRFVFVDHRTLVIADDVAGSHDPARSFTWLLHGNGGGDSGGSFTLAESGGVWTQGTARLANAIVFDQGSVEHAPAEAVHEEPGSRRSSHVVLRSSVAGDVARALQVIHPSRRADPEPVLRDVGDATWMGIELTDAVEDRRLTSLRRRDGATGIVYRDVATDGSLLIIDAAPFGAPRLLWADQATYIEVDGQRIVEADGARGVIAWRRDPDGIDVVADAAHTRVVLRGDGIPSAAIDEACGHSREGDTLIVRTAGPHRFRLSTTPHDGRPVADGGADRRTEAGTAIRLDGHASCDPENQPLQFHWRLVSAPAGSAWELSDADSPQPRLHVDRSGTYRVRLTVTDEAGQESTPDEIVVVGGAICADGRDDDLDGLFDHDDADCDRGRLCPADCNGDGHVTIDELVRGSAIANRRRSLLDCSSFDRNDDLRVDTDELRAAIRTALGAIPLECATP